jgi:hypothetical protein
MKKAIIIPVLILGFLGLTASGYSQSSQTRDARNFTKISFGVAGDLIVNIGPEYKVVLEGEKRYIDNVVTEVSGGRLIIKKDNWRFSMNEKITAYVTLPELKGLGVSGSGKAEIREAVRTGNLDLSVSGSGKINASDLSVSSLDCSISGSGNILIDRGEASEASISVSGSGNYLGEDCKIGDARIEISGSGNCTCNVTESLKASVSGSGNVNYEGNPRVDAHVSGSGKVRSR